MGIGNRYFSDFVDVQEKYLPSTRKTRKVLCLGYPDLLVDEKHLVSVLGQALVSQIPEEPLSDIVRTWHKSKLPRIYDPLWIFKHLGFEVVIFDTIAHRGIETLVDLNEPISNEYHEQFDLVIDTGTLEHCFNVGQAFKNVCQTLKQGGIFMSAAPITKLDHGYWNFGTLVYIDGFEQNGFKILKTTYTVGKGDGEILQPELLTRWKVPLMSSVYVIARREHITSWTWPVQKKYETIQKK